MEINVDCVILCGGKSSRLSSKNGLGKAFLPFGEKSLIAHNFTKMQGLFGRVFIACKDNQKDLIKKSLVDFSESKQKLYESIKFLRESSVNPNLIDSIFIIESTPIFAPIVGIISAFLQLQSDRIFFISCDCPFIAPHTIKTLCESAMDSQNYDIVFAKDSHKIHPLIAVWSKNTLPFLQDALKKGDFRLQNIFEKVRTKAIIFSDSSEFLNINTISDYNRAIQILG